MTVIHLRMDSKGGRCSVTRTRTGAWIVRGGLFPRRRYRTYRQALLEHARRVAPRVAAAMRAGASCLAAGDLT